MHRVALVVLALSASSVLAGPPPPPKFVGKKVRVVENGVKVTNILKVISDVSRVNIVLLGEPSPAVLDIKADPKPWDQLLAEVVGSIGLSMHREGNVIVVGTPARLKTRAGSRYTAKRINLALDGADVRDAVELVSRNVKVELGSTAGTKPLTLALRNAPGDQLVALLMELTGAKAAPRKPAPAETGCLAPKTALAKLKLVATATGTATPMVVVVDEAGRSWFGALKSCVGVEKAEIKIIRAEEVVTNGTHDLRLGSAAISHDSPKSEAVAIDALLAELDAPGALAGTGRTGGIAHKRVTLRFLRDVLGLKTVDEPLPRDEITRLAVVPYALGERVDVAIAEGLHAKPDLLKPLVADEFTLEGSVLLDTWLRLEVGDKAAALQRVTTLLTDLEGSAADELELLSSLEAKPLTALDKPAPQSVTWLPSAIAKLKSLGVPAKEVSELEQRAKALAARYAGG